MPWRWVHMRSEVIAEWKPGDGFDLFQCQRTRNWVFAVPVLIGLDQSYAWTICIIVAQWARW